MLFPYVALDTDLRARIPHNQPARSSPHHSSQMAAPIFDDVVYRFQKLSMPTRSPYPKCSGMPTLIDTFTPRRPPFDLSPTSSASSDVDHSVPLGPTMRLGRLSLDAFMGTRSRVVRLYNLPPSGRSFLATIFCGCVPFGPPVTLWALREDYPGLRPNEESVWAVFKSHEEAKAALSLSGPTMSVAAALESDLEPFQKLRRLSLTTPVSPSDFQGPFYEPSPGSDSFRTEYTISSNPPNARTSFRLGDWICSSPNCAAHNFGRNLTCIGCGCPRTGNATQRQPSSPPTRLLSSPRFVSSSGCSNSFPRSPISSAQSSPTHTQQCQGLPLPAKAPHPSHPLLTPSGRAFALGGKVQNVSNDPLTPCVMYWPDNEPVPEQGQIRPSGLAGVPQPPILNTGNRGPIEHQPGDWICLKCNYLNWRRRKVCQTCFPYAEGNGDSISAAVQAERIALLTSVLTQAQGMPTPPVSNPQSPNQPQLTRSHSLTPPPQALRSFVDLSPPKSHAQIHRSQSHFDLGAQYALQRPIYQTSGHSHPSHSFSATSTATHDDAPRHLHAPVPLLPSFLQDIVQSPSLSPMSTPSAEISFDEYDKSLPSPISATAHKPSAGDPASNMIIGNIWKLNGDETKTLSAFALPNHEDLMGGSRKSSCEM